MQNITYFHRNPQDGFSILKVSRTFIDEIKKKTDIEEFFVPHEGSLHPIATLKNIWFVFKHRNKNGINHITGDIHFCMLALIGCKSVLTIHDTYSVEESKNPIKQFIRNQLYYKFCVRLATQIVCVSEKTKNDVHKITKKKNIKVIYNAISPLFRFVPKQFNEEKTVILQIGASWNKNLRNTIKALANIPCELRIVGKLNDEITSLLEKENISFVVKTNLSEEEIVKEYEACDIVCFCSIFEGFGMPVIEGNAVGRCVIASDIEPITEIAADAACLVNPNDISSIADGFKKIISDADHRQQLIDNGQKNIKRFQAENAAKQYLQVYNDLIK
jgi:glycosyltransferase involved in cell wall biosynthesis